MPVFDIADSRARAATTLALSGGALDPSGFQENTASSFDAVRKTDLISSPVHRLGLALDERRARIEELTGQPYGELVSAFSDRVPVFGQTIGPDAPQPDPLALVQNAARAPRGGADEHVERREAIVDLIRESLPEDERAEIPTLDQVRARADAIAVEAEAANAAVAARATGLGVLGQVTGSVGATFTDPPNVASLLVGAPARIPFLGKIGLEAVLGATTEAVQQPIVQGERARLGLDAGPGQAAENILFAGLGAGAFSAVGEVVSFTAKNGRKALEQRLGRRLSPAEDAALEGELRQRELMAESPYPATREGDKAHGENYDRAIEAANRGELLADDAAVRPEPVPVRADSAQGPILPGPAIEKPGPVARFREPIANVRRKIGDLVRSVVGSNDPAARGRVQFAEVDQEAAARLEAAWRAGGNADTVPDFTQFRHTLSADRIRHIFAQHGNEAEETLRGQRAITPEDLERLPDVLADPDQLLRSRQTGRQRLNSFLYSKEIGNGEIFVVEEVRTGRKNLEVITAYIRRRGNGGSSNGNNGANARELDRPGESEADRNRLPNVRNGPAPERAIDPNTQGADELRPAPDNLGATGPEINRGATAGQPDPEIPDHILLERFDDLASRRGELDDQGISDFQATVDRLATRGYEAGPDGRLAPIPLDEGLRGHVDILRGRRAGPKLPKFPVLTRLKKRGVDPDSFLGQELKARGVTAQSPLPAIFRRPENVAPGNPRPLTDLDDFTEDLHDADPDFGNLPRQASDGRIADATILDLIDRELSGDPFVPPRLELAAEELDQLAFTEAYLARAGVTAEDPDHVIQAAINRFEQDTDPETRAIREVENGEYQFGQLGETPGRPADPTAPGIDPAGTFRSGDRGTAARSPETGQPDAEFRGNERGRDGTARADEDEPDFEPVETPAGRIPVPLGQTLEPEADLARIRAELNRIPDDELARLRIADPDAEDGATLTGKELLDEIETREATAREVHECVFGPAAGATDEVPF